MSETQFYSYSPYLSPDSEEKWNTKRKKKNKKKEKKNCGLIFAQILSINWELKTKMYSLAQLLSSFVKYWA